MANFSEMVKAIDDAKAGLRQKQPRKPASRSAAVKQWKGGKAIEGDAADLSSVQPGADVRLLEASDEAIQAELARRAVTMNEGTDIYGASYDFSDIEICVLETETANEIRGLSRSTAGTTVNRGAYAEKRPKQPAKRVKASHTRHAEWLAAGGSMDGI